MNRGRGEGRKRYDWLGGGVTTYPSSHQVELLSKGKMYLIDGQNADFNMPGASTKRQGFSVVGSALESTTWSSSATGSATVQINAQNSNQMVFCQSIVAGSTDSIASVAVFLVATFGLTSKTQWKNIRFVIRADSAGSPGSLVAATAITEESIDAYENLTFFTFPVPPTLTSGTTYWFCFEITTGATASGSNLQIIGSNASGTAKYGATGYTGLTSATFTFKHYIFSASKAVQGLYDYKIYDSSVVTQFPIGVANGNVKYYNGSAWSSAIKSGLASTKNDLFDFETIKNMLIFCDNATNSNQVWDGAASSTSPHGYRGTFSIGQSASAGGPWSAAGVVKVMLVTQLVSGGYRASAVGTITLSLNTNKIDLSSIAVDAVAAQFGFDIGTTATTVYCTLPNGSIYYKVPAASLSTAGNPIANNQTSNSILPMTDATLIAGGAIESNLTLPTGYFTSQVNTPKSKYLKVFQDFLVMAGDPDNLSSIWISEQYAPQIWSTYGASYGVRIDISTDDGEVITGLAVADGALFVGKQHNLFRIDYTGDFNNPFRVRKVHGQIGVLSHWTMQVIPDGLFFLSERGPSICYGSYTQILPQTSLIQNKFDNLSDDRFELSAMRYSTACNDTSRNQIMMTTSSANSTIRDGVLVYNYSDKSFMFWRGMYANYMTNIVDTNNFPVVWTGNYSAQIFSRSSGYYDNYFVSLGIVEPVTYRAQTPNLDLGEPTYYKEGVFLEISGLLSASDNPVLVDVFLDKSSTARTTLVYDTTKSSFQIGQRIAIPGKFKTVSLRFRNSGYSNLACELYWIDFTYSIEGLRT